MATLKVTVRQTLEADTTLTNILTGGIWDATETDREGLNVKLVRDANGRIKPCAVIRWRNSGRAAPHPISAETMFFDINFYEDSGWTNISAAILRVKQLFDHQFISPASVSDASLIHLIWAGDLGEQVADDLGGAAMDRSRYQVNYTRK